MKLAISRFLVVALSSLLVLALGCSKKTEPSSASTAGQNHHHHAPPHGGTLVVLSEERFHLELVLDASAGKLQAYLFDGHLENFVRSDLSSFEVEALVKGASQSLVFKPVANPATGETVGDTSLFEAQADWLKSTIEFEGTLKSLTVRGSTFANVKFNFPLGNEQH